jgi:serine/threonine-protein kinase
MTALAAPMWRGQVAAMRPTSTFQCATCGGILLAGERFCGTCGAQVADSDVVLGASETQVTSRWDATLRQLRAATLGEFEIKRELGRGGMAAVYLAHEIALNRKVALKVMAPGMLLGEGMVERFRFEAVTIANLTHPHIVRIHAVRQVEDIYFFVMQYMAGRSLERIVRETGPLPFPVVRVVLSQISSALGYAHRRGVVHRDVKPGNILFDSTGDAVVTDFGIAKVAEAPSQTIAGSVVGTPSYMSPEQCFAHPLTGASDQYSLGIVAYEMLTGTVPFTGATYVIMQGHTQGQIAPITDRRPDCPPDLDAVVRRMLARQPNDRFTSMAEVVKAVAAPVLADDDALREQLIALAAVDESAALDATVPTPVSPIPQTRRTVPRPTPGEAPPASATPRQVEVAVPTPAVAPVVRAPTPADRTVVEVTSLDSRPTPIQAASPARARRWLWALPVVVIAVLAPFVARRITSKSAPPTTSVVPPVKATPPAVPSADSVATPTPPPAVAPSPSAVSPLKLVILPPALPVRANDKLHLRAALDSSGVLRAGTARLAWRSSDPRVAAIDPRTGDVIALAPGRAVITAQSTDGEGILRLTIEPAETRAPTPAPSAPARDSVVSAPAPVPVATSPAPAPRLPERPAKTPAELRAELDATIRGYAQAIQSGDLSRLRAVYPTIPASETDRWKTFFEGVHDVKITVDGIEVSDPLTATVGTQAHARVQYTLQYSIRRAERETGQWQAVLERTASTWRIISVR